MKNSLLALTACAALAGCGVETASTAATVAAMKKQEVEQGQKTMAQMKDRINASMQQLQERADSAAAEDAK
ncbi:MAG TPA: hypothetical protein VFV74_03180 [Burkholderiales bacterium]|nr:hypothetical protein [Burkholderiales bacterium]